MTGFQGLGFSGLRMRKSLAGLLPRTRDDAGPVAREALALGFRVFLC